jgi:hypothetical protein
MTDEQKLQFAIEFAEMDLDHLEPWQELKLDSDVRAFVAGSLLPDATSPSLHVRLLGGDVIVDAFSKTSATSLRPLQRRVQEILTTVSAPMMRIPTMKGIQLNLVLNRSSDTKRLTASVSGDMESAFLFRLMLLLSQFRTEHCKQCKRIFLKRRRMEFCGSKCRNVYNTALWRTSHAEKVSDRQHEKYRKRIQRKTGSTNVAINRRKKR